MIVENLGSYLFSFRDGSSYPASLSGSANCLPAAHCAGNCCLEQLPSQRHRFFRTIRNYNELNRVLNGLAVRIKSPHQIDMAQLDRRSCGRLNFGKFGALLQCLPRCFELAVVVLKDRDFVAFKTYRSETNAAILRILVAVAPAQIVGRAEIDDRCDAIEFDTGNKTTATGKSETQIAATVFPFVAHKGHSLFSVVKTKRTGQGIHGVQGENSTSFPRLRSLFVIRRRGRLCVQQLW